MSVDVVPGVEHGDEKWFKLQTSATGGAIMVLYLVFAPYPEGSVRTLFSTATIVP